MKPIWRYRPMLRPELWLILAQILVLVALGLGLQFVLWTSGGTLFLFSAVAPLLILVSVSIVGAFAIAAFRQRHSMFNLKRLQAGQVVFRAGDPSPCAYFIQRGEVEVLRRQGEQDRVLERLRAGDYFGEVGLLSDEPRSTTVRAVVETQLAVVGKQNFLNMFFAVPSIREHILKTAHSRATLEGDENNSES